MAEVTSDGVTYDFDTLSDKAKQEFANLQATDHEIKRLNTMLAIAGTARNAYAASLKAELPQVKQ